MVLVLLGCLPPLLDEEGLVGRGFSFPVQCLLYGEPVRNNAKWMVLSQTQPPLCHPSVLFSPHLLYEEITLPRAL